MSASQFRMFLAVVIVLGVVGWFGWSTVQSQSRISDCVAKYGWTQNSERDARALCSAAERGGRLTR